MGLAIPADLLTAEGIELAAFGQAVLKQGSTTFPPAITLDTAEVRDSTASSRPGAT